MRENKIQTAIRLALAERHDNTFWRNNTGTATHYKGGKTCPTCKKPTLGARVYTHPYGLCVGSSDLIGMVPISTIEPEWCNSHMTLAAFVGLEVKGPRGRESDEQKRYRELVNGRGGVVEVVRSVDEAHDAINRIKELEPWMNR